MPDACFLTHGKLSKRSSAAGDQMGVISYGVCCTLVCVQVGWLLFTCNRVVNNLGAWALQPNGGSCVLGGCGHTVALQSRPQLQPCMFHLVVSCCTTHVPLNLDTHSL
jgi:hypothetical protein